MFSFVQVRPCGARPAFALPRGDPAPPGRRHKCQMSTRELLETATQEVASSPSVPPLARAAHRFRGAGGMRFVLPQVLVSCVDN